MYARNDTRTGVVVVDDSHCVAVTTSVTERERNVGGGEERGGAGERVGLRETGGIDSKGEIIGIQISKPVSRKTVWKPHHR